MLIESILYSHVQTTLEVKLKPIFEALRKLKEAHDSDEKVRTLEKPISTEVWEYLEEQVEQLVNSKVRTLKTLIIPNEKAPEGANFENGATNGLDLEPNCINLAHFSLHDTDTMSNIRMLLSPSTKIRNNTIGK